MDFIKIKNICSLKDTIKKMKIVTVWEKLLQITYTTKDLYPEYIQKTLKNSTVRKQRILFKNKRRILTDTFKKG